MVENCATCTEEPHWPSEEPPGPYRQTQQDPSSCTKSTGQNRRHVCEQREPMCPRLRRLISLSSAGRSITLTATLHVLLSVPYSI